MVDLKQTPKQIAIDLINEANGTNYTTSTISLGTPATNTTVINGLNTSITLSNGSSLQSLGVAVQYNRLSFKKLLARPYCQLEDLALSRLVDLIPYINQKYELALTSTDIVDGPYRPDDVAPGVRKITLSVADNHLVYTGSVTIYLGTQDAVYSYFNALQFMVAADYNTINYMGGHWTINGQTVVDVSRSLAQRNGITALYLSPTGKVIPSNSYKSTTNKLLARFRNNRLVEILGLNGETSYDNTGALLPKMPVVPSQLSAIPETLGITAALNAGVLSYSLTFDVTTKRAATGTVYYVDIKTGVDTNDGTTAATAFKTFKRALNALPAARVIRVKGYSDAYYDADSGWTQTIRNRTVDIVGYGDSNPVFTSSRQTTNWSGYDANTWYTSATDIATLVDKTVSSVTGYGRLLAKTSAVDCANTPHSFYVDNTNGRVYVHLSDNRKPDTNVYLIAKTLSGSVADSANVFMEKCNFDLSYNGFIADMTVPRAYGYLYMSQCTFGWTFKDPSFGSYGYNVAHQNCIAQFGFAGGFRYSTDRVLPSMNAKYWVIENRATVSYCGFDGNHTSSASRLASYGTILRINSTYTACDGNHVNDSGEGTFSLNIACQSTSVTNALGNLSHYCVGANSLNSAAAQYWSCKTDNSAFSFTPNSVGKIALFDTDIGSKPATQVLTPYQFIYTA
ncbi:hypothetical protein [Klebsiella pneumoniae]|uniref:DUF7941 domain-family protein n=1 Tax=Klebsiella pneumoniae TaxID=573 RepID=UPI000D1BF548|nr:hypothetical protein [Klebsiella pneumoniae]